MGLAGVAMATATVQAGEPTVDVVQGIGANVDKVAGPPSPSADAKNEDSDSEDIDIVKLENQGDGTDRLEFSRDAGQKVDDNKTEYNLGSS